MRPFVSGHRILSLIPVIPREGGLPLVEVLGIAFLVIGNLGPFGCVKNQLADRHAGIDFDRPRVDVCHLQRDRTPGTRHRSSRRSGGA